MTLEIEFKNLLNEEEYILLNDHFNNNKKIPQTFITTYFDTINFQFKEHNSALRVRKYTNYTELTLKQKTTNNNEHREITQQLSSAEEIQILNSKELPLGTVNFACHQLIGKKINLHILGGITTTRSEIAYKDGLLVLDKSYYLNNYDFELEYEVSNYEKGKNIFKELLLEKNIPERPSNNKIKRFMQRYNELNKINN